MHITHLTEHNLFDPDSCSGTPFWISKGLDNEDDIELYKMYISPLRQALPLLEEIKFQCRRYWLRFYKSSDLARGLSLRHAEYFAQVVKSPLSHFKTDVILTSCSPVAGAFLETKIPIVYWTDANYAGLSGFYPRFMCHDIDTMWDAHFITNACLHNAKQLIFSSQWAARSAIELYGISKSKIQVVPYGANLDIFHTHDDVKEMIKSRSQETINFLFVGKDWYRKGGDIVLTIVKALNNSGHPAKLTIVSETPDEIKLPSYVTCLGMISKRTQAGLDLLHNLYKQAHFLFVPSRADAYGIVFCEANSFGVPSLTTYVGGIPEVVKNNINGMTFSLEATIKEYCDYIVNLMSDYQRYTELAMSSFNEFQTRLNWKVASHQVKKIISEIL